MSRDSSTADRIFEILRERGISQAELSKRTGIPTSTISDWKRKGNTPTAEKIAIVAKALQVRPEEILESSEVDNHVVIYDTDALWEVVRMYEHLDEKMRQRLLAYLKAFAEIIE